MTIRRVHQEDTASLTKLLAEDVLAQLSQAIAENGVARLAVSGGSSPIPVFEYLSSQNLDWAKVKITLVDDRCVAETHPDSNARLAKTHLLKDRAADAEFIALFCDDTAESELSLSQHFPSYDVVILGMGLDAHTASIFPEADERDLALARNTKERCLLTDPKTAKHMRITQTLPQLLKTDFLAVHITGEEKWQVLEPILEKPASQFPISHFIHQEEAPVSLYYTA